MPTELDRVLLTLLSPRYLPQAAITVAPTSRLNDVTETAVFVETLYVEPPPSSLSKAELLRLLVMIVSRDIRRL